MMDKPHANCKYRGNDAWDCGHIDNSENCDCHVCGPEMLPGNNWVCEFHRLQAHLGVQGNAPDQRCYAEMLPYYRVPMDKRQHPAVKQDSYVLCRFCKSLWYDEPIGPR